ncbi:hypothetical protein V8B97DRAFT_1917684 [Scleroderma yunnanense]
MHKEATSNAAQELQLAAVLHDAPLDHYLDCITADMSTDIAANAAMSISGDFCQCSISDTSMASNIPGSIPGKSDDIKSHFSAPGPSSTNAKPDSFKTNIRIKILSSTCTSAHFGSRQWTFLNDPFLQPYFVWDTQHLYKHNGECFECFVDEPWTGNQWWNIQKCGNLPTDIWNSNCGLGGGQLVGWLPIIPGGSSNDDYEEQCVMALIRGLNSHCPCPMCLMPFNQLCDHMRTHPLYTSTCTMWHFDLYQKSQHDGDELMQQQSWQPVKNAFWHVNHSDLHHALFFDILHYEDLGN